MKFSAFLLLLSLLSAGCTVTDAGTAPRMLTVYAAASLTEAFTEMGTAFEASHPGVTVSLNFGGSQNLRTQIEQGAPVDVFASANQKEIDALVSQDLVRQSTVKVFLTNRLVVILPKDNPAGISSLEDLSQPGLKLVLAAEEVPAGSYARQALENLAVRFGAHYRQQVLANVVSNEDNIRQVLTKVQLGEADAGIVYVSDAVAVPELLQVEIPADANVIAEYPITALAGSEVPELANEFVDYVLSPAGQATLEKWGFTPAVP
jgi:molybdate transport system substrate-binding protein